MDDPELKSVVNQTTLPAHFVGVDRIASALPLARARNRGAATAIDRGADLLIFLDVDCVPAPGLVEAYENAAATAPNDLLCGPVAYLPPPEPGGYDLHRLDRLAEPHPARPCPLPGELVRDNNRYHLFWSLSFAITTETWERLGGFHEGYLGYGAEDTEFAYTARTAGSSLAWVGGARAFHQHHRVSSPPTEHLEDIIRNATLFHQRWDEWPMPGWLKEFTRLGLIEWSEDSIRATCASDVGHDQVPRRDPRRTDR